MIGITLAITVMRHDRGGGERVDAVSLHGERQLIELVDVAIDRRTRRELPIITVWAPRGCGLEHTLGRVEELVQQGAPIATVDGNAVAGFRPHEVALWLTWQLGQHRRGFGQIRFQRLLLGITAVRAPRFPNRPDHARRELIGRIVPDRSDLEDRMAATVGAMPAVIGAPSARDFVETVVRGVFPTFNRLWTTNAPGAGWYRTALGGNELKTVDALVELARQENVGDTAAVDAVLCAAFAEDIADAMSSRGFLTPTSNPLVVFTSSNDAVCDFLSALPAPHGPGSLVVLAGSDRSHGADGVAAADRATSPLADASLQEWFDHRGARPGWSRRYPLHAGSEPEIGQRAGPPRGADAEPPPDPRWATPQGRPVLRFARRLTQGHSGGLADVLGTVPATREHSTDLRSVLASPDSGRALDDQVVENVLTSWGPEIHQAVLRMALLRDLEQQRLDLLLQTVPEEVGPELLRFCQRDMWIVRAPGATPRMHPWARRAIAHRIGRADDAGVVWADCHEWLREKAPEGGSDPVTAAYHDLALGSVGSIAHDLGEALARPGQAGGIEPVPIEVWYDRLRAITRAPVARPAIGASPTQACELLLAGQDADPDAVVRPRLVAAMQLHTDPLGDPRHELCLIVAAELTHTAMHSAVRGGTAFLLERAQELRLPHG